MFLLYRDEPVRIKALAEQMNWLCILIPKCVSNSNGDIKIVCNGLRPGEKLFEELLFDAESEPMAHSLIFQKNEPALQTEQHWSQLDEISVSIDRQDAPASFELFATLVPKWHR